LELIRLTPSHELLASDCPPRADCSKIVRRRGGVLTVVGVAVTAEVSTLGVGAGEGAVDISEELLREAYAALVRAAS